MAQALDDLIYRLRRSTRHFLSDRTFIEHYYRLHFGHRPNLKDPTTFNEKLLWLKLHYRPRQLSQLVDKLLVRDFVADRVGSGVLVPLHSVYNHVDEIDPDALPETWVLKPSHGSGWVVMRSGQPTDDDLDWSVVRRKLSRWLNQNYYFHAREWAYRDVVPRIVCEHLLTDDRGQLPNDFKFFCFDGSPKFVQVDIDRFGEHQRNFYDLAWRRLPFELLYPSSNDDVARPIGLARMEELSAALARGFPFCRVDLYCVDAQVYFGELTFFPENGIGTFRPPEYDDLLGEMLSIPLQGSLPS